MMMSGIDMWRSLHELFLLFYFYNTKMQQIYILVCACCVE
jgi:hypothetical protein